jgi:prolipoprotein diacylglyceryltransferase
MASTKNRQAKITVLGRHGHLRPRVRYGGLDLEGGLSVVVIAIILAARLARRIFLLTIKIVQICQTIDKIAFWSVLAVIYRARLTYITRKGS